MPEFTTPVSRFVGKDKTIETPNNAKHVECSIITEQDYFEWRHIELALAALKRAGVDKTKAKFRFASRFDLSSCPHELCVSAEKETK